MRVVKITTVGKPQANNGYIMRQILTIILLSVCFQTFGDNGPKHSESISIKFSQNNNNNELFDSIYIIVANDNYSDTAFLPPYTTAQYWTKPTLSIENEHYKLFTHGNINSFKIITFKGKDKIESDYLINYPGSSIYFIDRVDNERLFNRKGTMLVDNSPLLHQYWKDYLFALFLTITIELFLGFIIYYKNKTDQSLITFIIFLILINALTHFSLWFVYSHFNISLLLLETFVVIIECLFWKIYFRISTKKAIVISILLNLASWGIGAILAIFK